MSFAQKVYSLVKQVPKGKVTTYKSIAQSLNSKAYRAVGYALRHSPGMPEVPCHRVVRSDGTIGGFDGQTSGPKVAKKKSLLTKEGIRFRNNKVVGFDTVFCQLDKTT